jgi:hypothetical protein
MILRRPILTLDTKPFRNFAALYFDVHNRESERILYHILHGELIKIQQQNTRDELRIQTHMTNDCPTVL